jgi:hypothetical protein
MSPENPLASSCPLCYQNYGSEEVMAHKGSIRSGIASGVFAFVSTTVCLGAGVTVITHGWQLTTGNPEWVTSMAQQIGLQASEAVPGDHRGFAWYLARISREGILEITPVLAEFEKHESSQPDADSVRSGEVIVTIDWSNVANHLDTTGLLPGTGISTEEIADTVLPLLTTAFPSKGASHPLAELPIHLIGHSRGGSVMV